MTVLAVSIHIYIPSENALHGRPLVFAMLEPLGRQTLKEEQKSQTLAVQLNTNSCTPPATPQLPFVDTQLD
jgi:hypothetical protein